MTDANKQPKPTPAESDKLDQEIMAELVRRYGQAWVDAHKKELDAQREYAKKMLGF